MEFTPKDRTFAFDAIINETRENTLAYTFVSWGFERLLSYRNKGGRVHSGVRYKTSGSPSHGERTSTSPRTTHPRTTHPGQLPLRYSTFPLPERAYTQTDILEFMFIHMYKYAYMQRCMHNVYRNTYITAKELSGELSRELPTKHLLRTVDNCSRSC